MNAPLDDADNGCAAAACVLSAADGWELTYRNGGYATRRQG
jgi:hypothetical protein